MCSPTRRATNSACCAARSPPDYAKPSLEWLHRQNRAPDDQIRLHGEFFEGELSGKRIALIHFEQIGKALVRSGQYDLVCYGHTHQYSVERDPTTGAIRGLNPGEIFGLLRADSESTFVTYDTESGVARKHVIDASGRVTSLPV